MTSPQADAAALLSLAERCEREDIKPDTIAAYMLDCAIRKAVHPEHMVSDTATALIIYLPYTTSLDAAVSLVPEGFVWLVETLCGNSAQVIGPEVNGTVAAGVSPTGDILAKTPALALCAAALRAHAALAGTQT